MKTNRTKVCDLLKVSATHPERKHGTIVAVRHDRYMRIEVYDEDQPVGTNGAVISRLSIDGLSLSQFRRILKAIVKP